jgi:dTDP-4-amino-4,6-dideoxygalactose transaminase
MDVGDGDEVIITGFTCSAVPLPILHTGAVPVYADIGPRTYNMDPNSVKDLIGPKTKVLIIQHTFGIAADLENLVGLARGAGLYIIEDSCLALGSKLKGMYLGGFGDASIVSFELSKTLSAGWGGMVQVNSQDFGQRIRATRSAAGALSRWEASRRLIQAGLSYFLYSPSAGPMRRYGMAGLFKIGAFRFSTPPEETCGYIGPSFLKAPHDTHWQVIYRQLQRLDEIVEHSGMVADRYRAVLRSHEWPEDAITPDHDGQQLIRFPLLVDDRDEMIAFFEREGIDVGRWFDAPVAPLSEDPTLFQYPGGQCPVAEKVSGHVVNLPLHTRLSEEDIAHICDILDRYLREFAKEPADLAVVSAANLETSG